MQISRYDRETVYLIASDHDYDCIFQASCEAQENAADCGDELTEADAVVVACGYLRDEMKTCDCRTGFRGLANGWGWRPFRSVLAVAT